MSDPGPVILAERAKEKGTYLVNVSFHDELGLDCIPKSATWSLTTRAGVTVNGRVNVAIGALAVTVPILLSGLDLAILVGDVSPAGRVLTVEWVYDSSMGADLPGKEEFLFFVDNLTKVT